MTEIQEKLNRWFDDRVKILYGLYNPIKRRRAIRETPIEYKLDGTTVNIIRNGNIVYTESLEDIIK